MVAFLDYKTTVIKVAKSAFLVKHFKFLHSMFLDHIGL